MYVHRRADQITIWTPAKLNLFLEVLGRRPDGFHEIETVMVAVKLFDTLTFRVRESADVDFAVRLIPPASQPTRLTSVPQDSQNLVMRAIELLRQRFGITAGASVGLLKRIPAAAGLGGGSSDAAAALVAANLGWKLNVSRRQLTELASQLGSDVPFFLHSSLAVCRGRGERVERLPDHARRWFVIARPPVELSTADVYRQCRIPQVPRALPIEFSTAGRLTANPGGLFNRLQGAASQATDWIEKLRQAFARSGCGMHQMSGSGSSYFGVAQSAREARQLASRLKQYIAGQVFCACSYSSVAQPGGRD